MSSLPLISHHLFVAAIESEQRAGRKPAQPKPPSGGKPEQASELRLELVQGSDATPAGATRPLRTSLALSAT